MTAFLGIDSSLTGRRWIGPPADLERLAEGLAHARGIELVRKQPEEARQYLKGYTAIEGPMTQEVPLAAYTLYNEFTPSDLAYFQKFFDLFSDKGVFAQKVSVDSMLYKG